MLRTIAAIISMFLLGTAHAASPWDDAFNAWREADARAPRSPGGVVFVGSSSVRLWDGLEQAFGVPVIQRGFGGSQLADCVQHLEQLVVRYRPRLVLLYAGDNDLASGALPADILKRFEAFADGVHAQLPETRIAFVSIKPSPAREAILDRVREANALVERRVAESGGRLGYIDVFTPMLGADGRPRKALFRQDALHLNAQGYALWRSVIHPHVSSASAAR